MRRLLFNPLAATLITGFVLVFWLSLHRTSARIRNSSEAVTVLQQEVFETASEITKLEDSLAASQDPFTLEQVARNELLLQKPGEIVLKLPDVVRSEALVKETASTSRPIEKWIELVLN